MKQFALNLTILILLMTCMKVAYSFTLDIAADFEFLPPPKAEPGQGHSMERLPILDVDFIEVKFVLNKIVDISNQHDFTIQQADYKNGTLKLVGVAENRNYRSIIHIWLRNSKVNNSTRIYSEQYIESYAHSNKGLTWNRVGTKPRELELKREEFIGAIVTGVLRI